MTVYTTSDFDYALPDELIAQYPLPDRSASRLLCLQKSGAIAHHHFSDLPTLLTNKDLLVFNNTKVIPARLFGQKASGGKIECLVERVLSDHEALCHIKASKSPKVDSDIILADVLRATVLARVGDLFHLRFQDEKPIYDLLDMHGQLPLPPYIERQPDKADRSRYQTVYAEKVGAVAAPTAGLHFDAALLAQLKQQGVQMINVTLHVGAGTFQPVRVEDLSQHHMHSEYVEVGRDACDAVTACKQRGGRVIAVGTTSIRCLETAAKTGTIQPYTGDTNLFITPGFEFQCVDALITNFHLPKSTLLMLVSALAGYEPIRQAYAEAVAQRYRFFSYGDAMFIS